MCGAALNSLVKPINLPMVLLAKQREDLEPGFGECRACGGMATKPRAPAPAAPTATSCPCFSHKDPSGRWEQYTPAHSAEIAAAMAKEPSGGIVTLSGIPFEVRFGSQATSRLMPQPPATNMIQVRLNHTPGVWLAVFV